VGAFKASESEDTRVGWVIRTRIRKGAGRPKIVYKSVTRVESFVEYKIPSCAVYTVRT